MSIASGIVIHAGKPKITALDVETNFRIFGQALGGDVYTAGVNSIQAQGTLTAANFRPHTGIPNSCKTQPYSLAPIRTGWDIIFSGGAGTTVNACLALQDALVPAAIEFDFGAISAGTLTGTVDVTKAGTSILSGGAQAFTTLAADTRAGPFATVAGSTLATGDVLKFTLVISTVNINVTSAGITLWCLSKHVE